MYVRNCKIYEEAKSSRIDIFIIKLIRDIYAPTILITTNNTIYDSSFYKPSYLDRYLLTTLMPLKRFYILGPLLFNTNSHKIPLIHHVHKRPTDTIITYIVNPLRSDPVLYQISPVLKSLSQL